MSSKMKMFKDRRDRVRKRMVDDSLMILFGPAPAYRNNDVYYNYRQDSDFYYLTGFPEESSILVMTRQDDFIFVRPRDKNMEIWHGYRLGVENAAEKLLVNEAYNVNEFWKKINEFLKNKNVLYHSFGQWPEQDEKLFKIVYGMITRGRAGVRGPVQIIHSSEILHEMRLHKTPEEIALMRESARITRDAHRAAIASVRPGMLEYELESVYQKHFRKNGAFEAYPSIVASGARACVLHYTENNAVIGDNELVLVDAGSEYDFMAADVTRTFPANGKFTPEQRRAYEIVLRAQKEAIEMVRPGITSLQIHERVIHLLTEGLLELGLLTGSVEENIREPDQSEELANQAGDCERQNSRNKEKVEAKYKRFYMHKTSHWLGMDVHDVGRYYDDNGEPRKLEEGMVLTIEPGLYIPDEDDIPERFRGIGIRIEDDILVTSYGYENLTADIPKEIQELEELYRLYTDT